MLVKLQADDITSMWEIIKPSIAVSLPPAISASDVVMNNVLKSLLVDDMQCWAFFVSDKIIGTITTTILFDKPSGVRNLLIYSLNGFEKVKEEWWEKGLKTIKDFAKSIGASNVVGYTRLEYVKDLVVKKLNGNSEYFVSMEVK